jgi:hypothetical protein
MLYGLISPEELTYNGLVRICEVVAVPFEVAPPLTWIVVSSGTTADTYGWDGVKAVALPSISKVIPVELTFPDGEGLQLG